MITTAAEYEQNLVWIHDNNAPALAVLLPSDERIYNIDLNKRVIETPEFLSVEKDHRAECVYFLVDRFFDNMDLSTTTCVIQYKNAQGEERVYAVPYYDIQTYHDEKQPKMLIPWAVGGEATKYAGEVIFSIRFYKMNTVFDPNNPNSVENRYFTFNLNTQPSKSQVLYGLEIDGEEESDYLANIRDEIYQKIAMLEHLKWIDI